MSAPATCPWFLVGRGGGETEYSNRGENVQKMGLTNVSHVRYTRVTIRTLFATIPVGRDDEVQTRRVSRPLLKTPRPCIAWCLFVVQPADKLVDLC